MGQQFVGQVAIITGAGGGLGAAIARALASAGARCVLAGRRLGPLQAVGAELQAAGGLWRASVTDVRDEAQVERLVADTVAAFGGVDVLINNAGVFRPAPIGQTSSDLWDETLAINLRGPFMLCRAVWAHLLRRGGGQIVNISSVAGVQAYADEAAYCASKFGLNGLTEALALEGKPQNIRVFAVCPGSLNTPIWEGRAPAEVTQRMMKPEPMADLICWLLAAPRDLDFGPIVVRNFRDPWLSPPAHGPGS